MGGCKCSTRRLCCPPARIVHQRGWGAESYEVGLDVELASGPSWNQFPYLSNEAAVWGYTTWGPLGEVTPLMSSKLAFAIPLWVLLLCQADLTCPS